MRRRIQAAYLKLLVCLQTAKTRRQEKRVAEVGAPVITDPRRAQLMAARAELLEQKKKEQEYRRIAAEQIKAKRASEIFEAERLATETRIQRASEAESARRQAELTAAEERKRRDEEEKKRQEEQRVKREEIARRTAEENAKLIEFRARKEAEEKRLAEIKAKHALKNEEAKAAQRIEAERKKEEDLRLRREKRESARLEREEMRLKREAELAKKKEAQLHEQLSRESRHESNTGLVSKLMFWKKHKPVSRFYFYQPLNTSIRNPEPVFQNFQCTLSDELVWSHDADMVLDAIREKRLVSPGDVLVMDYETSGAAYRIDSRGLHDCPAFFAEHRESIVKS